MTIAIVRELTSDDYSMLSTSDKILAWLTGRNPYSSLLAAWELWKTSVDNAETAVRESAPNPHPQLDLIEPTLTSLLFASRMFLDRTDKWLVDRYGAESDERKAVKQQTSHEYDTRLGYAVASNLRNIAQHAQSVVGIHIRSGLPHFPDDPQARRLVLEVGADLSDPHWQAPVRRALRHLPGPADMIAVTNDLIDGCGRVMGRVFTATEGHAADAAALVNEVAVEIGRANSQADAVLMRDVPIAPMHTQPFKIELLHPQAIPIWQDALSRSKQLLSAPMPPQWPR